MEGSVRFLARVWRLICEETESGKWIPSHTLSEESPSTETIKSLAKTTAKVESYIEGLQFNTAISALMVLVNHLTSLPRRPKGALLHLAAILAPFAPHLAEEMHQRLGGKGLVSTTPWPTYRLEDLQDDVVELPVQVNSKLRGKLLLSPTSTKEQIEKLITGHADFTAWTGGKKVQKIIVVPGRIVNLICP